jgi:hypothetical protein
MKKLIYLSIMVVLLVVLTGCIETTTVLRVRNDGSGTIEETLIFSKTFMELLAGMGGEAAGKDKPDFLNEDELRENAPELGEGVTFVSAEKVDTERGSGYAALYEFKDINKVRINQNPGDKISLPSMGGDEEETPKEYVHFHFTKGKTSTLEIINPIRPPEVKAEEKEAGEGEIDMGDAGMVEMMKELYRDMKIALIVEVEGKIVDTNANFRDGSRITIMELDFGKLMEDEEAFQKLMSSEPETIEDIKEISKEIPGIKVETEERIVISFK